MARCRKSQTFLLSHFASWFGLHILFLRIIISPSNFYLLILYPVIMQNSLISFRRCSVLFWVGYIVWDFLCKQVHHLQIGILSFLPFQSECLWFLFLALLQWLELPIWCWITVLKTDISAFFPILDESIQSLSMKYDVN